MAGSLRRRLARLSQSETGAELIEFALTLPLLLLLVLGIIEFGFLFREYETVTNAAREGARIAVLPDYTSADAIARANAYLTAAGLTATHADPTVSGPTSQSLGAGLGCVSVYQVTVTYPHAIEFLGGIMSYFSQSLGTITLSATSQMRSETGAVACS
jgi:Flp pilus assembly protein TadG